MESRKVCFQVIWYTLLQIDMSFLFWYIFVGGCAVWDVQLENTDPLSTLHKEGFILSMAAVFLHRLIAALILRPIQELVLVSQASIYQVQK